MKLPLVTVLTPTYNHSRFIEDCIRSLLAQSFQDWEQIIIDDGSTDDTREKACGFHDERITYIYQNHVGLERLSETYNRGLRLARGEYVAILEGDDMWPKRKLELQLNNLDDDTVLSFGKCLLVDQFHKCLGVVPVNPKRYRDVVDWLSPLLVSDYIVALTVMMRKDALEKIGGFIQPAGGGAVDYSTFLELALVGRFKFVNEVFGIWVKHGDNYSDRNLYSSVVNNYGLTFCKSHGIPVDWKQVGEQMGRDLFHVGRHQLLNGERYAAQRNFKRSFKLSSISGKVKALMGYALSMTKMNFERFAGIVGRPTEK